MNRIAPFVFVVVALVVAGLWATRRHPVHDQQETALAPVSSFSVPITKKTRDATGAEHVAWSGSTCHDQTFSIMVRCLKCGLIETSEKMKTHSCPEVWSQNWSLRLGGAHPVGDRGVCARCGHALREADDGKRGMEYSDEVTIEAPTGHVVFNGCVWCLARSLEHARQLEALMGQRGSNAHWAKIQVAVRDDAGNVWAYVLDGDAVAVVGTDAR